MEKNIKVCICLCVCVAGSINTTLYDLNQLYFNLKKEWGGAGQLEKNKTEEMGRKG